jgi:hypothetical protein
MPHKRENEDDHIAGHVSMEGAGRNLGAIIFVCMVRTSARRSSVRGHRTRDAPAKFATGAVMRVERKP